MSSDTNALPPARLDASIPIVVPDEDRPDRAAVIRGFLKELWQDKPAFLGTVVLSVFLLTAVFGSAFAPSDPTKQNILGRLQKPAWSSGDWSHPLGTDSLGRDVLSRLIYGCRTTLLIGVSVVLIAGVVGILAGLIGGYRGGRTDAVIMRTIDTQFAFPGLLLAITIITMMGAGVKSLIVVLSIGGWMLFARVARAAVLAAKAEQYVEAAVIAGAKESRVIFRHLLPNLISPLLTLAILEFAVVVLGEASLSFLGLGVQDPQTSWGLEISLGRQYIFTAWWLITFPGIALAIVVLSSNLLAGWLRVVADPQARDKRFAGSAEGSAL